MAGAVPSRGCVAIVAGPLAWPSLRERVIGLAVVLLLTVLTEVGGLLVWPALGLAGAWGSSVRATLGLAVLSYGLGSLAVPLVAARLGRVPLPCLAHPDLAPASPIYCLLHRHYVRPALRGELEAIAARYAEAYPGERVRYLDAGFPIRGVPLIPHLSHHDGRKLDLALPGRGGSPLGYLGYVAPPTGRAACAPRWLDRRWDLQLLQPLIALDLDRSRASALVGAVASRRAVGRILLEPHVEARLSVASDKIRFQGCHAARHDDHLHLQLR